MACVLAVSYHGRNLPHYYPPEAILFITWRLFGSMPACGMPITQNAKAGSAFIQADRLLDKATTGARWLSDPRIAEVVADILERGEHEYRLYERFAWAIMPNHVHLVIRPFRPLPQVMRWIKGSSAREANLLLGRTGTPFWLYESYDHCVRDTDELNRIIHYVERNPVKAGLVDSAEAWSWSSAGQKACFTRSS